MWTGAASGEACSIRINKQWRICFRWQNGDVLDAGSRLRAAGIEV